MADFAPGFEPNISLGVAVPQPAAASPIEMAGGVTNLQNTLNQIALFRQQMAARQKLGQIIAAAPDMESALAAAQKQPDIAAFIPDVLAADEGVQSVLVSRQAQMQDTAQTAEKSALSSMLPIINNRDAYEQYKTAAMATVSPSVRGQVGQGLDLLYKGWTTDLDPSNPAGDFRKRAVGTLTSMGVTDPGTAAAYMNQVLPSAQTLAVGPGGAAQTGILGPSGGLGGGGLTFTPGTQGGGAPAPGEPAGMAGLGQSSAGAPLQGPSIQQQATAQAEGATAGDLEKNMRTSAQSIPTALFRINVAYNALSNFLAGGGEHTMADLAQGLQAVRNSVPGLADQIPASAIDKIARGKLGDAQLFDETIVPTLHSVLAAVDNSLTAQEINSYIETITADSDPRAILGMLDSLNHQVQTQAYVVRGYNEFKQLKAQGDPSVAGVSDDMYPVWFFSKFFDSKGNPTDPTAITHLSPEGIPGIEPGETAAGTPASAKPKPQLKTKKDYLDFYLGGAQ